MSRWILKMSPCGSNAGMGTSAPLINAVVNNILFHSSSLINRILPQIIHILCFSARLAALYFEINVLRSGLFSGQKSRSSYKSLTLLHYWTESSESCTESGQTQLAEKITTSRIYQKWKKCSERCKHCALCVVRRSQKSPPPQTAFSGARDGQNLISWRWSLLSPTDPVWWRPMHAISSYRGNRPANTRRPPVANRQDR